MKLIGSISAAILVTVAACSEAPDTRVPGAISTEAQQSLAEADPQISPVEPSDKEPPQIKPVPVRIGLDGPNFDACGGYGQITGLNPQGDNFLSVRSAPNVNAEELDRLPQGAGVSMCDYADGWVGIVYQAQGIDDPDCKTGSLMPTVADYSGPCRSGWVSERFVELIAG